jgi:hypothetical protein
VRDKSFVLSVRDKSDEFAITPQQGLKPSAFSIISENAADALDIVRQLAEGGVSVTITTDDGIACDINRLIVLEQISRNQGG